MDIEICPSMAIGEGSFCIFVAPAGLRSRIKDEVGIPLDIEDYRWIVFLPQKDGSGAYSRYFGRISDRRIKMRGIMARRGDSPEYVRRMQSEMLSLMAEADDVAELQGLLGAFRDIADKYVEGLDRKDTAIADFVMRRRIGQGKYTRRCLEAGIIEAMSREGASARPGMEVGFVVRGGGEWTVDLEDRAVQFDRAYYTRLIQKARDELAFVFRSPG